MVPPKEAEGAPKVEPKTGGPKAPNPEVPNVEEARRVPNGVESATAGRDSPKEGNAAGVEVLLRDRSSRRTSSKLLELCCGEAVRDIKWMVLFPSTAGVGVKVDDEAGAEVPKIEAPEVDEEGVPKGFR